MRSALLERLCVGDFTEGVTHREKSPPLKLFVIGDLITYLEGSFCPKQHLSISADPPKLIHV